MDAVSRSELLWCARRALMRATRWRVHTAAAKLIAELVSEHRAAPRPPHGALAQAATSFELDDVETDALALTASVEIDARFGAVFALLEGVQDALRPTVGTLLELTGGAGVASFLPEGRLRRHALVDIDGDAPLVYLPARCPVAVWARLLGAAPIEGEPPVRREDLVLTASLSDEIVETGRWLATPAGSRGLVVVCGRPGTGRHAIARAILTERGCRGLARRADVLADTRRCVELERDARWRAGDGR